MADADELLGRLRAPGALVGLADLVVADALARPLAEVVPAEWIAAALREVLRALLASTSAGGTMVTWATGALAALGADARPVVARLPAALHDAAQRLAELPWSVRREHTLRILDREPVRQLLRAQVLQTLIEFARRVSAPLTDNPVARGLGGLSRLAFGRAARPGGLGSFASAFTSEAARHAEKRAAEFADPAVSELLEGIAVELSDPGRAPKQAALRVAVLEGVLEMTGAELAAIASVQLEPAIEVIRRGLGEWAAAPSFAADVLATLDGIFGRDAARPLGDILADLGVRDAVAARAAEALRGRLDSVVAGPAFAAWLAGLLENEPVGPPQETK